ncbi:MAG: 16S rRNA (adenine(1518)-N(6)/adenine(1519)-N(6))-dimethyltransferase RsmA [Vicinamibacterales bacterium]
MKARRRFAQHFLEAAWVEKLVAAIDLHSDDWVLEIGPGRGALTRPLASRAARLLGVEIDRDLATALDRERLPNVTVLTGDVLTIDLAAAIQNWLRDAAGSASRVRVVGNLPYNVSSPILFRLLDLAPTIGFRDATLMLQKEVADRLVARVGTGEYGVLTIITSLRADVTRVLSLPPGAFRPAPKVHSAVVRLAFRPTPLAVSDQALLVRMVRGVFTQRRKTLLNALTPFADQRQVAAAEALARAGVDGRRRPETLTLAEFAALGRAFETAGS